MVEVSLRARESLLEIEDYIAGEGHPMTAAAFVEKLLAYALTLGPAAPTLRGFYVSRLTGYRYRLITHRSYRIVYTIQEERVIVADVFYGGRTMGSMKHSLRNFTA